MKESIGPSFLVSNVRSLNEENVHSKTKAQRQSFREAKNAANRTIAGTSRLEPEDDFSLESETKDESNHSEEGNKSKTEPIRLGIQKYGCPFCSKIMSMPSLVKRHIMTHTGEQPFICSVCGKAFNQKEHLKTHSLIHTGEKPFSCNICKKTFRLLQHLNRHLKSNAH